MPEMIAPMLHRDDVIKAVERRGPSRVPLILTKLWGEGLADQYGGRLKEFDRFPQDAVEMSFNSMDYAKMDLSWRRDSGKPAAVQAHDAGGIIPDWRHLDEFVEKMPDVDAPPYLESLRPAAAQAHADDRYLLFGTFGLFFERPWALRGMENLMLDYYLHPRQVHRLHDALCGFYERLIRRAAANLRPDAILVSDDLGNQRQLMMKPEHFREFLKPYYARVGRTCRECGMHFWLHSCGNNTDILDDLIEAGVRVLHPIQKHTMDEAAVARRCGDRLTFLAGFDVQHILQEGTPDDVRAEVRHLIDTFDRPDGGMCLAAGNGIVAGTPLENIEAFLDEGVRYGQAHRARM